MSMLPGPDRSGQKLVPTGRGRFPLRTGESGSTWRGEPANSRPLGDMLRRQRWTILVVTAATLVTVAALTTLQAPRYSSTTTILVESDRSQVGASPLDALQRMGQLRALETEMGLIRSRRVLEPVVDSLGLDVTVRVDGESVRPEMIFDSFSAEPATVTSLYRVRPGRAGQLLVVDADDRELWEGGDGAMVDLDGLRFRWSGAYPVQETSITVWAFHEAVAALQAQVSVGPQHRDSDLIDVACTAGSPEGAVAVCGAVSRSYLDLRTRLQRAEATTTAEFLGGQVEAVRARLLSAEDSLEAYGRRNEIAALQERASGEVRQLTELTARGDQLEAERRALAELIDGIRTSGDRTRYRDLGSFPTFLQSSTVTDLLSTVVELENRRSELTLSRSEASPDVQAVDQRIVDIESQLLHIAVGYESGLAAQIRSLNQTLDLAGRRLAVIPSQQVELARRERQATSLSELYQFLETRRREAEIAEAVDLPSVRILDSPSYSSAPFSPNWMGNLALGLLLGMAAGVGVGLAREMSDTGLWERREVEHHARLPVLSLIPTVKEPGPVVPVSFGPWEEERRKAGSRRSAHSWRPDLKRERRRRPSSGPTEVPLPVWDQEVAREAFQSLVADLGFLSGPPNSEIGSLVVTSAGVGEGKTFAACNLALSAASVGARTLLVDSDMRAGGVSRFFGFPPVRGLTDVLAGDVEPADAIKLLRIARAGAQSSGVLSVLASGSHTPNSAALLLKNGNLADLMAHLFREYQFVVIDTPPVNVLSDAVTVAAKADAVLIVVRGGVTDRDSMDLSLDRLGRAGATPVGVVLNAVELPRQYADYSHTYLLSSRA